MSSQGNGGQHRADWKGERVLLSGRVPEEVRVRVLDQARVAGKSLGDYLTDLVLGAPANDPVALDVPPLPPGPYGTLLADPPWRFMNRTGKVAPEHKRLSRYDTLSVDEISALPVGDVMDDKSHCYLWVPNA